jgi:pyruvate dehydrogenase E2 component (dihydrolipoamide acetyltransferase)
VDIDRVRGTGPGGRILAGDVEEHTARHDEPGAGGATEELFDRRRMAIAGRLARSKQSIPHFYVSLDADMTEAFHWRAELNSREAEKVSLTAIIVRACAAALRRFPRLNSHVAPDRIALQRNVHIGVATRAEGGLLVPVLPNADRRELRELSTALRRSAEAARRGALAATEAATFTVTSLGMYGVRMFAAIINPPECGILAVGAAEDRVVAVEGAVGIRKMMTLTLAADHRAVDGAEAAEFLSGVKEILESIRDSGRAWIDNQ